MTTPKDYGLEHEEFRPHQQDMIEWAHTVHSTIKVLEAPTGSGKTTVPRSLAQIDKTIALVRTKALQEANYEHEYGFIPLYGRSNYRCVYEKAKSSSAMADQCAFSHSGMANCPQFSICPYAQQKELAKASNMTTLNYAYWLHSYKSWPEPANLVCDEAHELSAIVLEWAGITVTEKDRQEWDLPMFPILKSGGSVSILTKSSPVEEKALSWLVRVHGKMKEMYSYYNHRKSDEQARKKARKAEMFGLKIKATMDAIALAPKDWFIRSGPNVRPFDRDSTWAFVCKPLTARHHFATYFISNWNLLLMSATIGNISAFAEELGLSEYDFRTVPSNWPPETRPVHALDVPRLGQKSTNADWFKQAEEIVKLVRSAPREWSGIIHVTSIDESKRLAERLSRLGLSERIYLAKKASTNEMVKDWQGRMKTHPGSLLITWALWEGYNGLDEKINICAKTPYPFLGDPFEIERRNYNGTFYLQRAAWQLEQGLGRTRRGRAEDYDDAQEQRGLVAIADGGYKWLRKYFSQSFMQSLVTP